MTTVVESRLKRSDFDYVLPPERIAQTPASPRDHSRLMVLSGTEPSFQHRRFHEIGAYLRSGDVLVLNATRVFPARLRGQKRSGGKAEILLLHPNGDISSSAVWRALVRGASARETELVFPEGLTARLENRLENGEWTVRFSQDSVRDYLDRFGEMPLPPYIKRSSKNLMDSEAYQTVFAREEGSIAAPTAGFHFTPDLLDALRAQGVIFVEIVLHVGWGTFRPVRADAVQEHVMLPESYHVSAEAAARLKAARRERRRIIAVGTTAVRTLESVYAEALEEFRSGPGVTPLFIYPGYRFKAVDALITNFHLPHSTPLLLACAFYSQKFPSPLMGEEVISDPFSLRGAYQEAIKERYRFYSYGDAMFIS